MLTPGQVEVVVANVTDRRAVLWADHEADLVPLLEPLDVAATATALQDWAAKADAVARVGHAGQRPRADFGIQDLRHRRPNAA